MTSGKGTCVPRFDLVSNDNLGVDWDLWKGNLTFTNSDGGK